MNKLILLSGKHKMEGFVHLDGDPRAEPDICAIVPPLPKEVRAKSWDEIYLIHGIEHFRPHDGAELLKQIVEVLAIGGLLVLEQPNLEAACRQLLGEVQWTTVSPWSDAMQAIYGDPNHRSEWMMHKWGYSPASLTEALKLAGFTRIEEKKPLSRPWITGRDFRLEATK